MKSSLTKTVTCTNCRAICCRLEVPLIDDSDDQVPIELTETAFGGPTNMKRLEDGWCIAVDRTTMKCSIYEKRPFLCRRYEVGATDCLEERGKFTAW